MITRRKFLKQSAFAGVSSIVGSNAVLASPTILTSKWTRPLTNRGTLRFRPYLVQSGRGPHLLDWAYATDTKWDAFHSDITSTKDGVTISDTEGERKFGIDVRWNVEGFGYIFITADNGGEFYELPASGKSPELNLNYELARSRVVRNQKRFQRFLKEGWTPSREVRSYVDLSSELLNDARRVQDETTRATLAQQSLSYAMWGSEMMELDRARFLIAQRGRRDDFYIGCDARALGQMSQDTFFEYFAPLFSFAMVTYFVGSSDFHTDPEREEGRLRLGSRDVAVNALREHNITVEGRGLYWFHKWTTPDWLKTKSFDELKRYVEKHTRDVIGHYRADSIAVWEVMNEFHDWANQVRCSPEQTIELTKLAYDVARVSNPKARLALNNCCPFAEYVQLGEYSDGSKADRPQRTPWEFTKQCIDAGVDFDVVGQQLYFPYRDLQDTVITIERLAEFKKPIQLSEIGCPGGPTTETVKSGKYTWPNDPFVWRRGWDEELAADWMEAIYTLSYAMPFVEGAVWFDLADPFSYMENGGLLRSAGESPEKKAAYVRFETMLERWGKLNAHKS
jgi:endo-1,4-beta-xylanase